MAYSMLFFRAQASYETELRPGGGRPLLLNMILREYERIGCALLLCYLLPLDVFVLVISCAAVIMHVTKEEPDFHN